MQIKAYLYALHGKDTGISGFKNIIFKAFALKNKRRYIAVIGPWFVGQNIFKF